MNIRGLIHNREQWLSPRFFLLAAIGSSIGLSNIWRFPYLTYKHGGWYFIIAYAIVLLVLGVPMLVLELAVGQKMQRASAAAMRGIQPRMAGVGWAAGFASFVSCIVYNLWLATAMVYLVQSGE